MLMDVMSMMQSYLLLALATPRIIAKCVALRANFSVDRCPMCPTTFTEKYRLKVHIKQMHEKTAEAICDHCGKLFGHRSLVSHLPVVGFLYSFASQGSSS